MQTIKSLVFKGLISCLGISLFPFIAKAQTDSNCYMVQPTGEILNLGELCGQDSVFTKNSSGSSEPDPTDESTPRERTVIPNPSQQVEPTPGERTVLQSPPQQVESTPPDLPQSDSDQQQEEEPDNNFQRFRSNPRGTIQAE